MKSAMRDNAYEAERHINDAVLRIKRERQITTSELVLILLTIATKWQRYLVRDERET